MNSAVRKIDFLHGPIFKPLVLFAVPIFFSSIFQQFYNTMDTMIVGNTLGDNSLAAIGACSAIYDLFIGFALGIGNGLTIVAARSYGANDEELLKKSVASSLIIGILISCLITLLADGALYPLMQLLDTPTAILDESYSYISTISKFTIVMFSYNLCAGMLRAVGDSLMPLLFLVFSSIVNIVLDYIFIVYLHMGVKGAAVATVISQGISVVLCLIYISRYVKLLIPKKKHFVFDKTIYAELAGQGISMGLMSSIVSAGSVILQYGINSLGTLVIAGHTAARKLFMFFNMPFSSMAASISTFVSQNKGANQKDRIILGMKAAYLYDVLVAVVVSIFLMYASEPLIALVSGSSAEVVLKNGAFYLKVVGPFYAVLGILLQTRNGLQGIGAKIVPLVSSGIELLGKILFVILFIPIFKYNAVIFCEPLIWCVMTVQLLLSFWRHPYLSLKN